MTARLLLSIPPIPHDPIENCNGYMLVPVNGVRIVGENAKAAA